MCSILILEHGLALTTFDVPFAIQIGISSKDEELKKLEVALRSKGYLAYSVLDRLYNNKIPFFPSYKYV